jgi:hypothetical protein
LSSSSVSSSAASFLSLSSSDSLALPSELKIENETNKYEEHS